MDQTVIRAAEDRVETRDDGSKIITPSFAKDAPAPAEKRTTFPVVETAKTREDELQKILAKLQQADAQKKQQEAQGKIQAEAKQEINKFDTVINQSIEEKKRLIKEKQALNLKSKEYEERLKKLEEYEGAKADPLKFLEKGGYKYEDLVNHMVNNPDSLSDKDKKLLALEQEVTSLKKTQEERARQEQEQKTREQFDRFFSEVKNNIDAEEKKVDYELIRVTESYQQLIDRMANIWRETGEIPDVHEVAKAHEDEIINYALETVKKSPKLQSKLLAVLNIPGKDATTVTSKPKAETTLSNSSAVLPHTTEVPIATIVHGGRPSNVTALQEVEEKLRHKGLWPFT